MASDLILTATAEDRPGVVEKLAEVISQHSGNWVDSAMARLGGEFAGIVRVSIDETNVSALREGLLKIAGEGIQVNIRAAAPADEITGRRAQLELTSQDHPGIVHEVSQLLSSKDVNVISLHTDVFTGSMSGQAMFFARADITLPDGLDLDDFRQALEDMAGDMVVDLEAASLA